MYNICLTGKSQNSKKDEAHGGVLKAFEQTFHRCAPGATTVASANL